MFKQFYKDIDVLHQLVKPFRIAYAMNKMADAWQEFADSVGGSLTKTLIFASVASENLIEELKEHQISD